jgi:hypothetical protein
MCIRHPMTVELDALGARRTTCARCSSERLDSEGRASLVRADRLTRAHRTRQRQALAASNCLHAPKPRLGGDIAQCPLTLRAMRRVRAVLIRETSSPRRGARHSRRPLSPRGSGRGARLRHAPCAPRAGHVQLLRIKATTGEVSNRLPNTVRTDRVLYGRQLADLVRNRICQCAHLSSDPKP